MTRWDRHYTHGHCAKDQDRLKAFRAKSLVGNDGRTPLAIRIKKGNRVPPPNRFQEIGVVKIGMATSVLLGKRLRRQIGTKVWPQLESKGFTQFAPLRAYREAPGRIDVVEFATFRPEWGEARWLGGDAYANGGTFTLHVGTYYLDVDALPWSRPRSAKPKVCDCHRAARLAHGKKDSAADGRTFWPGKDGERLEATIDEAVLALNTNGLGYLDGYADTDGWIATFDVSGASDDESLELTAAECADMMRIVREGRSVSSERLSALHDRLHLCDEHLTSANPCGDVLAALLLGKGRVEDALRCLDDAKREMLRQKLVA